MSINTADWLNTAVEFLENNMIKISSKKYWNANKKSIWHNNRYTKPAHMYLSLQKKNAHFWIQYRSHNMKNMEKRIWKKKTMSKKS